jgi:hypothetical protein
VVRGRVPGGGHEADKREPCGVVPERQGNAHLQIVPYQLFETADGYLVLNVGNDSQWQAFCQAASARELGSDPRFATNRQRVERRDELVPQVAAVMKARSTAEWVMRLEEANVPHAVVRDYAGIFAHEEGFLNTAELNGDDVKNMIFSLKISQFDRCNFDEDRSRFAIFKPYWVLSKAKFTGHLKEEKHPQFFPMIPVGESEWEFRIGESTFNGPVFNEDTSTFPEKPAGIINETHFDDSVFQIDFSFFNGSKFGNDAFTFPDKLSGIFDEVRFDESIFLVDFSAGIEIKWTENQRATFEAILPYSLGLKQMKSTDSRERKSQFMEPLKSVTKIVEHVKPIGVKVLIKYNCKGRYSKYQKQLNVICPGMYNV